AVDEALDLFSVPLDASAPEVRLSPGMVSGRNVEEFLVVPGGQRVAYRSDQASNDTFEVFSAPVDGSAASVRLNEPFAGGPVLGDVLSFLEPAHDAPESRVVFRADEDTDQFFQLYSARLHGPRDVRLISGPIHSDVIDFARSAAGDRVVYNDDQRRVLYSTRADGVGPVIELDRDDQPLPMPFLISSD